MEQYHVFISYAHIDNYPLPESPKGWVSYFDEALTNLLSQKLGKNAKIWRDTQMERSAVFDNEIFSNLAQSLTMVSVVSPRYIDSGYCLDELEKFRQKMALIENKAPVFKVVKTKVELEEMPEFFRRINGFDFYKIDPETKKPRELGLEFGDALKQEFFLRVSDLAYEIAELLKLIKKTQAQPTVSIPNEIKQVTPSKSATIYLAKTSSDFQSERDNIRRDLLERGYQVLPPNDADEPKTTEEYKNFVRENIRNCSLSVHIIGKNYGERPEDGDQSYIHLQSLVASEFNQNPNLSRIVWLPKDVNTNQSQHQTFVNEIWASTANGVEVLEKPLEEVKTNILDALNRTPKPVLLTKPVTAKPSILVLYEKIDAELAANLEKYLKEQNFSVLSTAKYLSGENSKLIEAQNYYLCHCDAVLIYWNNSPDFWARITLQKLQRIFGEGREEEFLGKALFADGDNTTEDFEDDAEADLVSNTAELDIYLENVRNAFQARFTKGGQAR